MTRSAAHLGSTTGHGGAVVEGSADVLVNGKSAIGVGHAAACPKHGKSAVATGKTDVLVNGVPMSRLKDHVLCAGPPSPGEGGALVDHGEPTFKAGVYDVYLDGKLDDVPEAELDALRAAIESGDPVRINDALGKLPTKAGTGKVTAKVVGRRHPNSWVEYEATGPGANVAGHPTSPMPRYDAKPGGGQVGFGSSIQGVGAKVTYVHRRKEADGSTVEYRGSAGAGMSEGATAEGEWSDRRAGISVDTPWVISGGVEKIVIEGAAGRLMPALDVILPPVSADVLIGG